MVVTGAASEIKTHPTAATEHHLAACHASQATRTPRVSARLIPTFTAEGTRWRDSSQEAIERWLASGRVIVKRSRNGRIVCAQFRYVPNGASPVRKTPPRGQRYSRIRNLGEARLWQHKRLVQRRDLEEREADLFVRAVFRAVPLSILKYAE